MNAIEAAHLNIQLMGKDLRQCGGLLVPPCILSGFLVYTPLRIFDFPNLVCTTVAIVAVPLIAYLGVISWIYGDFQHHREEQPQIRHAFGEYWYMEKSLVELREMLAKHHEGKAAILRGEKEFNWWQSPNGMLLSWIVIGSVLIGVLWIIRSLIDGEPLWFH